MELEPRNEQMKATIIVLNMLLNFISRLHIIYRVLTFSRLPVPSTKGLV